ncbi:MAG: C25 family cysteine peptidase [Pyrinomonadaceae bacterium]
MPSSVANLTIANTGSSGNNTVTGNSGQTVTNLLRVQAGKYQSASNYNNVQIDSGATFTAGSNETINVTGTWTNNGTFVANGSTVNFNSGGIQSISGSSITTFDNVSVPSNTTLGFGSPAAAAINQTLSLSGNVSNSQPPIYNSGSTLKYNLGNFKGRGAEWNATSGAGYPFNVQISNGTTFLLGLSSTSTPIQMAGTLTIDSSSTFDMASFAMTAPLTVLGSVTNNGTLTLSSANGGDIKVSGNWTRNSTATFTPNGRAVFFNGTGTQTVTITGGGTEAFSYLIVDKASGNLTLSSSPATSVSVNATSGDVLQILNSGGIDLNGQTLTLANNGGSILANGGTRNITGTGTVAFNGTKAMDAGSTGTLSYGSNVTVTVGASNVDFGNGLATIGGILQINSGSVASGKAPIYASTSTLVYNQTMTAGEEWYPNTTGTGAGVPQNVTINASKTVDFGNNGFARTMRGNLLISGTLTLSTTFGGDVNVGGDWTNNGTLTTNGRAVTFNGSANQNVGGTGTNAFAYLIINSAGVTLTANASISNTLTLTSGNLTTGTNTLTLGNSADISRTSGFVIGALKKTALSGAFIFTVGTAASGSTTGGYTPLDIANATGGGDLTVRTVGNVQPNVNASTSLKEYWTLTAGGAPAVDMTFHYLDGDVQGTETTYRIIRVSNGTPISFPPNCPNICVDTDNNTATITGVSSFSDWTLGQTAAPTAVKFGEVRAESYAEGVLLAWDSGHEVDNLGYNVYRELGGRRVRVNRGIVAGSALTVGAATELRAGQSYSWWDAKASGAAQYWIEDIDLNGTRTMHGPFVPVTGKGDGQKIAQSYQQPLLLSDLNAKAQNKAGLFQMGWPAAVERPGRPEIIGSVLSPRTGALVAAEDETMKQQWELAGQAAVKIGVKRDGWYRVTQTELAAAGLDQNADVRNLQLYVNGAQLPIRVNGGQTSLGQNGSIEFYGQGLDTATTDTHVYWLIVGTEPGLRIPAPKTLGKLGGSTKLGGAAGVQGVLETDDQQSAGSSGVGEAEGAAPLSTSAPSFAYTVERKERLIYFSSLLNGDEENYFGQLISTQPVTETLTVHNLAPAGDKQETQLEVALQGVSTGGHTVSVYFNDVELDKLSFNARDHASAVFAVPAALLHEGDNTVKLAINGTETDLSLVDYLRLTYTHTYRADGNTLRLSTPTKGALLVDGFTTSNIRVVDVTEPATVVELAPRIVATATGYAARVQTAGARTLLAFTDDLAGQAASVTANQPSTWHADEQTADMLIITHRSLRDSVLPLKALRESQQMHVSVVDVEDLYDEFSYGAHTPQAVKDFLQWTTGHWQQAPHYVLLAGDATIDPRNYEGRGDFDLVPTKLIDTASMETASDEWFADFNNEGVASMALGRLPVRTAQDAGTVVNKIVGFTLTAANQAAVLVSDRTGSNDLDFNAASHAAAAQLPPNTATTFINRNDGPADEVRNHVIESINAGPMVVNFIGHGSTTFWTGDNLLRTADATALTNGNRLSLFVMMTCLNGYFQGTALDSLSEAMLKAQQGGAVAVWASSGMTVPVEQQTVNQELYRQLFILGQPPTLGDAVRQAKQLTQDPDIRRTWILFGDPSMRLR